MHYERVLQEDQVYLPTITTIILVLHTKRNRRIAIKYEIKSCFVIELCSHNPLLQLYGAPIHKWGKKIERAADVDIGKIGVDKKRRPFGVRRRREEREGPSEARF